MAENFNITLDYTQWEKDAQIIDEVFDNLQTIQYPRINALNDEILSVCEGMTFEAFHERLASYNDTCVQGVGKFCNQLSSIIRSTIKTTDSGDNTMASAVTQAFSG